MTYLLLLQILSKIILTLCHLAYPINNLIKTIQRAAPWRLEEKPSIVRRKRVKRYKKPVRELQDKVKDQRTLWTYLFPAAFAAFKVGCCLESFIRRFSGPSIWDPSRLALQCKMTLQAAPPPVRFDSDYYLIGVDNHASRCMANAPHLFEDLHLDDNKGQVDGINSGLDIAGQGTFKFNIANEDCKMHAIKSPTVSTYLI
jgi:hypothetical protein